MSGRRTLRATRARHTRATARSRGKARDASTPEVAHAALWSPNGSRRPRQAQQATASEAGAAAGLVHFGAVYAFVRSEPADREKGLLLAARTELVLAACLVPLMGADLGRRFLPMVIACDAAPEYGFGVSYRPGSLHTASAIGSLAENCGRPCSARLAVRPSRRECLHHQTSFP